MSTSTRTRCAQQREGYVDGRTSWALKGLVFGLPLEYNIAELDACIRDGWLSAAQTLERHGARVVPVSLPSTRQALSAYYVIAPAEASSNLAKYDGVRYGTRADDESEGEAEAARDGGGGVLYARTRGAGFGAEVKRRILLGAYSLSSEAMDNHFIQAQRVRQLVRRDFDRVLALPNPLLDDSSSSAEAQPFDLSDLPDDVPLEDKRGPAQVDFLLCPTAPTLPPTLEAVRRQTPLDAYMNDVFTVPASLAGLPAVSVPIGVVPKAEGDDDAPDFAGLQLIGQYWDDARLLGVADALTRALEAGQVRE
jgi:aspartyl-tRNA(Asn)/glutamyl-tRNA(Gln) amidotransferase subunit A